MRHSSIKTKLQSRIKEEYRRAELLAQVPGSGSLVCNAIIRAGTIAAYAAVNQ